MKDHGGYLMQLQRGELPGGDTTSDAFASMTASLNNLLRSMHHPVFYHMLR
jgi:hypothetical protein